jgi:hypothetical protein
VIRASFIVLLDSIAAMRVRGVVVRIHAVRWVLMIVLPAALLMMPERHALPRGDRGHALSGNGQRQQHDSENPENLKHRQGL